MWEEKEGVMRNAMTTRAPGGVKKKILFTPSLPLYPTICFNYGFAGNYYAMSVRS